MPSPQKEESKLKQALALVEHEIVMKKEISRREMRLIINHQMPEAAYNVNVYIWRELLKNERYMEVRGERKSDDKIILSAEIQEPTFHGSFLCPRCKQTHEMEFRKLSYSSNYWSMCPKVRAPIFMALT